MEFRHVPLEHPAIDGLLMDLRASRVNGGALFASFEITGEVQPLWFFKQDASSTRINLTAFLASPALSRALPELDLERGPLCDPEFEQVSPLYLESSVATALWVGGANEQFSGTAREAVQIVAKFAGALFQDRYNDVWLFRTGKQWSNWFRGVYEWTVSNWGNPWDSTWVIIDTAKNRVSVLCITDTD